MQLTTSVSLVHLCGSSVDSYQGVYVGDLLSRAMVHLRSGNLWITIMNHPNVIAIASHCKVAAVLLAEGVVLTPDAVQMAEEHGVSVYSSEMTAYDLCRNLPSKQGVSS